MTIEELEAKINKLELDLKDAYAEVDHLRMQLQVMSEKYVSLKYTISPTHRERLFGKRKD